MFSLLISLALATSAPEPAAPAPPPGAVPASEEKARPKLVCRKIVYAGTRLAERECRTKEQWDYRADETGKWMEQLKN